MEEDFPGFSPWKSLNHEITATGNIANLWEENIRIRFALLQSTILLKIETCKETSGTCSQEKKKVSVGTVSPPHVGIRWQNYKRVIINVFKELKTIFSGNINKIINGNHQGGKHNKGHENSIRGTQKLGIWEGPVNLKLDKYKVSYLKRSQEYWR